MRNSNPATALLILLERNPNLVKQLFGDEGLTTFGNAITKHLANIENLTVADLGKGKNQLNGLGMLSLYAPNFIKELSSIAASFLSNYPADNSTNIKESDSSKESRDPELKNFTSKIDIKHKYMPFLSKQIMKEESFYSTTHQGTEETNKNIEKEKLELVEQDEIKDFNDIQETNKPVEPQDIQKIDNSESPKNIKNS